VLTNQQIKFIKSLNERKERYNNKLFVAEGVKVVGDLINSSATIKTIYALKSWNADKAYKKNIFVEDITEDQLKRISSLNTPNEVLALVEFPPQQELIYENIANQNILLLDAINDPGNMGTLLRLAHWFGIKTIIASTNTVDVYNFKTIQSGMGSSAFVSVYYKNLLEVIPQLKQPLYAADLQGDNLFSSFIKQPFALILGSESHGVSKPLLSMAKAINIPSFTVDSRPPESLNVAIAGAIILSTLIGKG